MLRRAFLFHKYIYTNTLTYSPLLHCFKRTVVSSVLLYPKRPILLQNYSTSSISSPLSFTQYHKLSDTFLDDLVEKLEDLGDQLDIPGYDVVYSVGFTLCFPYLGDSCDT